MGGSIDLIEIYRFLPSNIDLDLIWATSEDLHRFLTWFMINLETWAGGAPPLGGSSLGGIPPWGDPIFFDLDFSLLRNFLFCSCVHTDT